jgi:hypothetical protein
MGQKTPVEVQHAQETVELTGSFGRLSVLKMGYPFFQRMDAFGGHLVTEEGNLGRSKDALHWVDEDSLPLMSVTRWNVGSRQRHQCEISEV